MDTQRFSLPNGKVTCSLEVYRTAWRKLYHPIATAFNGYATGYNPGITIRYGNPRGKESTVSFSTGDAIVLSNYLRKLQAVQKAQESKPKKKKRKVL